MNAKTSMLTRKLPPKTVPLKKGTPVTVTTEIDDSLAIIKVKLDDSTQTGIVPFGSYDPVPA
jgi:hypothetical protein